MVRFLRCLGVWYLVSSTKTSVSESSISSCSRSICFSDLSISFTGMSDRFLWWNPNIFARCFAYMSSVEFYNVFNATVSSCEDVCV